MTNTSSTDIPGAVAEFVQRMIEIGFRDTVKTMSSFLRNGSPGRRKRIRLQQMHDWYTSLAHKDQQMLDAVVAEAAYAAVFNVLVLLDNDTGGPPLRPDSSDYAVYVHRYLTEADFAHNNPASSMRINDPHAGNPLHEILQELLPSDVDKPISLE